MKIKSKDYHRTGFASMTALTVATLIASFFCCIDCRADDEDEKAEGKQDKEEEAEEEGVKVVYAADRVAAIGAKEGEAVIVMGTVDTASYNKDKDYGKITFQDGKVEIYIPPGHIKTEEEWDKWGLSEMVDKEIYVAGQSASYKQTVQVHISRRDQIADNPLDLDLKKALMPKKKAVKKKTGPAVPGAIVPTKKYLPKETMELKGEEASLRTVSFYLVDANMKVKEDPFGLPRDVLTPKITTVNATVEKIEGYGPLQVVFESPDESYKSTVKRLLDQLAQVYGKWPADRLVTIDIDFDSRGFKDDPPTLVIAALLHSLFTGKEIPYNTLVTGEIEADGSISAPHTLTKGELSSNNFEILKAVGAEAGGETLRLVRDEIPVAELNDLALAGDWASLSGVSVLTATDLKTALQLIFPEPGGALATALDGFDQAQGVIQKSGMRMVKNKHVQSRVIAAGKAYPNHKSALFYAYYAKNKVPRSYSPAHTLHSLTTLHNRVRYLSASILDEDQAKPMFREVGDQLKALRPKLDPAHSDLMRALESFEREASTAVLRPKKGRGRERQEEEVKEADEKVVVHLKALSDKVNGVEEKEDEDEEEE